MNNPGKATVAIDIKQSGFSLVELIIFIVVVSVSVSGVLLAFTSTLRAVPSPNQITAATQLAQERMELILAQKRLVGLAAFTDPCNPGPGPAICTPPSGYAIPNPIINGVWLGNPITDFKLVTVTVTDTVNKQLIQLQTVVANY
jgi:type II secretory pathway pseudopilin PulG